MVVCYELPFAVDLIDSKSSTESKSSFWFISAKAKRSKKRSQRHAKKKDFFGKTYTHICDKCHKGFFNSERLYNHRRTCSWCDTCEEWVESRHLLECGGKKEYVLDRYRCPKCLHWHSRNNLPRHMRTQHGEEGWRLSEHPEAISRVG